MTAQDIRDENLLVVAAVEGYALKHGIKTSEALDLFDKNGIVHLIRSNYSTLHTQSLSESAAFAEDILARQGA